MELIRGMPLCVVCVVLFVSVLVHRLKEVCREKLNPSASRIQWLSEKSCCRCKRGEVQMFMQDP